MSQQRPGTAGGRGGRGGFSAEPAGAGRGRGRSEERGGGGRGYGGGGGERAQSAGARGRMTAQEAELSLKTMFMGLKKVNVKETKTRGEGLTARPGYGEMGTKVKVFANHFKVADLPPNLNIYQYDVAIERHRPPRPEDFRYGGPIPREGPPPMPDRNRSIHIMKAFAENQRWTPGTFAYDGQKILYTFKPFIPQQGATAIVTQTDAGPGVVSGASARTAATTAASSKPLDYEVRVKPIETTAYLPVGQQLAAWRRGEIDAMPRESLHALDVALRQTASQNPANRMVSNGIYQSDGRVKLGFGLEAWHGYIQSLNLTGSGLTISMDAAVIAMPVMEDLLVLVADVLRATPANLAARELTKSQIQALNDSFRRRAVTVQVNHRSTGKIRHRVRGATEESATKGLFELKDGTKTTVAKYFKAHYNMELKFPHLPCVIVGSRTRPEWLPIEVCRVVPDVGSRALGPEETTKILEQAAVPPNERRERIKATMATKAKLQSDLVVKSFGMALEAELRMMECIGRVLPVPTLRYGGNRYMEAGGGKGDWNIMNTHLYKAVTLSSYAIVSYARQDRVQPVIGSFVDSLHAALQEKGIAVTLPHFPPVLYSGYNRDDEELLQAAVQEAGNLFKRRPDILFIIEEKENQVYSEVKRICDCVIGIQSQVLVAPNIALFGGGDKMGRKMAGVALKVNTKLGGENTAITGNIGVWCPAVKNPSAPSAVPYVMLLGADVSHPTNLPGQGKTEAKDKEADRRPDMPSVAAITGSINLDCTRFACRIYAQDPLQEIVADMAKGVYELLGVYGRTNNRLPDTIIMFRDGVSEGQFSQVLDKELAAIKLAVSKYKQGGAPYLPRITFVTVQKRHGTRFFPAELAASDEAVGGRSRNVRPGVVVDKEVCSLKEHDFYLNSHAGIQGTNKAAKYSVLSDDVGFSADSMQLLAYWLCHTFCRCTRTVSYCPPAYYAHHAAFRGRCWLRKEEFSETASASSGFSGGGSGPPYRWDFSKVHDNLKDTMFYIQAWPAQTRPPPRPPPRPGVQPRDPAAPPADLLPRGCAPHVRGGRPLRGASGGAAGAQHTPGMRGRAMAAGMGWACGSRAGWPHSGPSKRHANHGQQQAGATA